MFKFGLLLVLFSTIVAVVACGKIEENKSTASLKGFDYKCGYGYGYNYGYGYSYGCDYGDGSKNELPIKKTNPISIVINTVVYPKIVYQNIGDTAFLINLVICDNDGKLPTQKNITTVKITKALQEFIIYSGKGINITGNYLARVTCKKGT